MLGPALIGNCVQGKTGTHKQNVNAVCFALGHSGMQESPAHGGMQHSGPANVSAGVCEQVQTSAQWLVGGQGLRAGIVQDKGHFV